MFRVDTSTTLMHYYFVNLVVAARVVNGLITHLNRCFQLNLDIEHLNVGFELSGLLAGFEEFRYIERKHLLFPTIIKNK